MYRHILAIIHFNRNFRREVKTKKDGTKLVNVVYPKYKNGEGTVRDVRVKPIFGKIVYSVILLFYRWWWCWGCCCCCCYVTNYYCQLLNVDYVDEIFNTVCSSIKAKTLKKARQQLKTMTPPPMNMMLDKQPKSEALQKREDRRQMVVKDVPPSMPGIYG